MKVDLTTEMVKEFTSLQGVVGGLYAREEGYPEAVWQAIYDQYLPASTEDPIPRGTVGRLTALADRMDTLAGLFGLGHVPTSSRDPFGLRRAAQGVVRIALEGGLAFDLDLVAAKAARLYTTGWAATASPTPRRWSRACGRSSTIACATSSASPATPTTRSRRRWRWG